MKQTKGARAAAPHQFTKQRCLEALNRMGGIRETQELGAEEMRSFIYGAEEDEASTIISLLSATGQAQKPFARRESVRLLGQAASSESPAKNALLQTANLNKALAYIKSRVMDADAATREACADSLVAIMHAAFQSNLAWASDSTSNPVLKLVFELITDPKKETAAIGCLVLGKVAKGLQALAPGLWKVVLRLLNSAHYHARPHLIAAIASCSPDCTSLSGLIAMRPDSTQPHLSQIIGQPAGPDSAPSSGLLGCCTCQDWLVRKAAVDGLRAIAVGAGMHQDESQIQATISLVASIKHDTMRPVRTAAGETISVLKDLQTFRQEGGRKQAAWAERCCQQSKNGCVPATPPSPSASSISGSHRKPRTPLDAAVHQRFKRSAAKLNVVLVPSQLNERAQSAEVKDMEAASENSSAAANQGARLQWQHPQEPLQSPREAIQYIVGTPPSVSSKAGSLGGWPAESTEDSTTEADHGKETPGKAAQHRDEHDLAIGGEPGHSRRALSDSAVDSDHCGSDTAAPEQTIPPQPESANRLSEYAEKRPSVGFDIVLEPAVASKQPSLSTRASPRSTGTRLAALDHDNQELRRQSAPGSAPVKRHSHQPGLPKRWPQQAASASRSVRTSETSDPARSPRSSDIGEDDIRSVRLHLLQRQNRLQEQNLALFRSVSELAANTKRGFSELNSQVCDLEQIVKASPSAGEAGFPGFGIPAPVLCESPVKLQAAPAAARILPVDASEDSTSDADSDAPNLESMYSEALHNASGMSAIGELELLRLMQRTGAAFNDLSAQTSDRLLRALTKLLKERTAISRITTYLMHLPDTLQVVEGTKAAVLAALSRIPSAEDELLGGQVSRLHALLRQMWQKQGSGLNLGAAQTPPELPYRQSLDGLPQLQAELEAMQRSLKSL